MKFKLVSPYKPAGDQPEAIASLVNGLHENFEKQTLLGVTGSGKTFTIANVIEKTQLPTLVIAHNKTLAAQLCNEFREFFPDNAVEYFVSYYDYYQPEAYMPGSDTYIEKEAQVNEEIDRLRHACTQALLTRRDVIIVASVSAIYGLGSPAEYEKIVLHLRAGDKLDRTAVLQQLVEMQFTRTNSDLTRGTFRLRGQVLELMPVNEEAIYRLEIGSHIISIEKVEAVSRRVVRSQEDIWLFPAKHYVASDEMRTRAFLGIQNELEEQLSFLQKKGNAVAHERLKRRVKYDLEMIKNIGYCNGIENYSRHFDGRAADEPPFTLLDYFKYSSEKENESRVIPPPFKEPVPNLFREGGGGRFLTIIDESHVTVPQIRGMYHGDRARKDTLVEHGFRLPSARDNRPLKYEEFETRTNQVIYVSATPAEYELKESQNVAEQIVRPTGLVDPEVLIRPVTGKSDNPPSSRHSRDFGVASKNQITINSKDDGLSQVDDVIMRIQDRILKGERTLVTTLTKKMAEDLTEFLVKKKIKVEYLHSDVHTINRIDIITKLRRGDIDVIVGVNLLREGLDIPEVSLVAILDADKEGFLRSETSLIQTIGRAARNANGLVVLYADQMTGSIERALAETARRREKQLAYNKEHGITPKTIEKTIRNILEEFGISTDNKKQITHNKKQQKYADKNSVAELDMIGDARPIKEIIKDKTAQMKIAAQDLEFELAAILRDEIRELSAREKITQKKRK